MKKAKIPLLIVITSVFLVGLSGLFCFRNFCKNPVAVSKLSTEIYSTDTLENPQNLLNINFATIEQLSTLPGIGQTLAQRIVAYRDTHGTFRSLDQLLNVEGIGTGKLNGILDLITIGGNTIP